MEEQRVRRVLQGLREKGLFQLLVTDPISIFYLTGIKIQPGERFYGLLLRQDGEHRFFLNHLFAVPQEVGVKKLWYFDTDSVAERIAPCLEREKCLGIDGQMQAKFLLPLMEMQAASGFVVASDVVDQVRGRKEQAEQEKMRQSSRINDLAMAAFRKLLRDGVTEKEVAEQMLEIYRRLGAEGFSFAPLVAFGANAADPHHAPDDTVLREGDVVLLDVGCIKDGYCSDMTRSFFYRKVSEKHRAIYEIVREANAAAIAKIRPGIPLQELDRAARERIEQSGYGEQFNHRLGHSIGLSEHEAGDVSAGNPTPAETGMIFSIEPGIYLEGEVGVRIEDLVLVTETGCEVLNHFSKDLEIIGEEKEV